MAADEQLKKEREIEVFYGTTQESTISKKMNYCLFDILEVIYLENIPMDSRTIFNILVEQLLKKKEDNNVLLRRRIIDGSFSVDYKTLKGSLLDLCNDGLLTKENDEKINLTEEGKAKVTNYRLNK